MNRFWTILSGCSLCLGVLVTSAASSETSILFVGDTHFGENYQESRSDNILESEGYQYTIQNFSAFLRSADAVIANLETPITDLEESPYDKSYVHWADPVLTPYHLLSNNISVVSLANNHTLDYGVDGFLQTLEVLQGEGMSSFGAGLDKEDAARPYIRQFQVGDQTFTLGVIGAYNYRRSYDEDYHFYADDTTPGTYTLSAEDIGAQVAALKDENPDIFIVAFPHWGSNYAWKTDEQTEMGHDLIDSGVDMVIGHGAHMMQEVERYHDRWIVYSLGNMVFNSGGRYASYDAPPYGFILELALKDTGAAVAADFRLYPIFTNNKITNFQSRYVSQGEFDEVEGLLLDRGGLGSWEAEYTAGQDDHGNHYLEFPLIDGFVETEFMYDDFEGPTPGSYTLGSDVDAALKTSSHCRAGSCIRLQDDRGTASSFFTTGSFDASQQDRIEVDFWMKSRHGEDGDSYFVKYFDGSEWLTVATFVHGTDFVRDDIQNRVVVIDGSSYTLSGTARVMFEAAGKDDSDDLYFDQIRISGLSESGVNPPPDPVIWMSFRSGTSVPGLGTVADEDIVSYDEATEAWAIEFDGSDVGLADLEISGLAALPSGDLLLSFKQPGTVGGLSVDDSDIVRFAPTSLGPDTAGTFSRYFDGSDVGLTANGEDVDAIALAADGRLIISTKGSFSGDGASGADEDLFIFTGTLGRATSGSFARYFDGSDVGLDDSTRGDVDAATLTNAGELLFSTVRHFTLPGASGSDEDIVEFSGTFGRATSGTFSMRQLLGALGIAAKEDVGSLHLFE